MDSNCCLDLELHDDNIGGSDIIVIVQQYIYVNVGGSNSYKIPIHTYNLYLYVYICRHITPIKLSKYKLYT